MIHPGQMPKSGIGYSRRAKLKILETSEARDLGQSGVGDPVFSEIKAFELRQHSQISKSHIRNFSVFNLE